ncbi:MAG: hypothetical protein R3D89_13710 [Sphingomonadaceae bacterium]
MDNLRGQFGDESEPLGESPDIDAFEDDTGREPPPLAIGQDERRMQVRAYNFWAGLLHDKNFPSIEELDAASQPDFGPFSVLLDFTSGIENPAVAFLGDQLATECGTEGPIERLDDVPSRSLLSRITDHYLQILANQAPIGFEAEFVNQRGATILYRGILLPFSSDDDTIDFIYGVINWKELADQATTDELMLEIEQALDGTAGEERESLPMTDWADSPGDEDVLDLGAAMEEMDEDGMEIPEPEFSVDRLISTDADEDEEGESLGLDYDSFAAEADDEEDEDDFEYGFDDYGEEEEEDEEGHDGFASLTSIGGGSAKKDALRANPLEDLDSLAGGGEHAETPMGNPMPTEYQPAEFAQQGFDAPEYGDAEPATQIDIPDLDEDEMDLADWLASARDLADAAKASEDRSRKALYDAIGRAYDFALAAAAEPDEFAQLVEDSGLTMQERAPLTPLVKLVFGVDYDKTRLAEYASVLAHAQRIAIERGALADHIAETSGGLKAIVAEERRLRRVDAGEQPVERTEPRNAIANKLRKLAPQTISDIPSEGSEFTVLLARRTEDGEIVILGEVADDVQLVERAAKKLLG